ncbi:hypothetical protein B0H13DRAFT_2272718 [Mycena leptocephala]|nr:hypothetical protein B0H13DRAFT_2272718 [Mycena leptocephala]
MTITGKYPVFGRNSAAIRGFVARSHLKWLWDCAGLEVFENCTISDLAPTDMDAASLLTHANDAALIGLDHGPTNGDGVGYSSTSGVRTNGPFAEDSAVREDSRSAPGTAPIRPRTGPGLSMLKRLHNWTPLIPESQTIFDDLKFDQHTRACLPISAPNAPDLFSRICAVTEFLALNLPGILHSCSGRRTNDRFSMEASNCDPIPTLWSLNSVPPLSVLTEVESNFPQKWLSGVQSILDQTTIHASIHLPSHFIAKSIGFTMPRTNGPTACSGHKRKFLDATSIFRVCFMEYGASRNSGWAAGFHEAHR